MSRLTKNEVAKIRASTGWRRRFYLWRHAFNLWKHFNGLQTRYTGFRECLNMADFVDILDD